MSFKKWNSPAEEVFTHLMEKSARMKELAENGLANSEGEISVLKMKTEQAVQLCLMINSLWHHLKKILLYQLKNWKLIFVQTIQLFIVIFTNFERFLNLNNGCLKNCLKSTANPELTLLFFSFS